MENIYLSRVDISNFRSFGSTFSLNVPPAPGLVLLHGMNGLGKTTFFEALEWLLTGDVRRISNSPDVRAGTLESYLTRHGAPARSHSVGAHFNVDNGFVERTSKGGPLKERLTDLLCRDSWSPRPTDLTPYMRLTMFLPQSKRFRFEEELPAEQWRLLEGPAGVERLASMRNALGSTKATNAFKRAIEAHSLRLTIQERISAEWHTLLAARESVSKRLMPTESLDLVVAGSVLDRAVAAVGNKYSNFGGSAEEASGGSSVAERVYLASRHLSDSLQNANERKRRYVELSDVAQEWVSSGNMESALSDQISALEAQLLNADSAMKEARERVLQLRGARDSAILDVSRVDTLIANLRKAETASVEIIESTTELARIRENNANISSLLGNLFSTLSDLDAEDERRVKAERDLQAADKRLADLLMLEDMILELDKSTPSPSEAMQRSEQLRGELERTGTAVAELEGKADGLRRGLHSLAEQKVAEAAKFNAMVAALAAVLDHITEETSSCPLCTAPYGIGELKVLGRNALSRLGFDSTEIDAKVAALNVELSDLISSIEQMRRRLDELPSEIVRLDSHRDALSQLQRRIDGLASSCSLPAGGNAAEIEVERTRYDAAREASVQVLSKLRSSAETESERQRILPEQFRLIGQVKALEARGQQLQRKLDECQAVVGGMPPGESWSDPTLIGTRLIEVVSDRDLLVSRSGEAESAVVVGEHGREVAEGAWQSAFNELQSRTQERERVRERRAALSERWRGTIQGDQPSIAATEQLISDVERDIAIIGEEQRRCEAIRVAVEALQANSEAIAISDSLSRIQQQNGKSSESEVTITLSNAIASAKEALENAKKCAERASRLAAEMKEKADEFNDRALKPLTSRIQQFHDVLSPFRYRIEWKARSNSSGTKLRQAVNKQGVGKDTPPMAELSDGQIAVQGLATLFAASTEYRWGRWPALLLDDPLQSADIIHASAFIDVIRGLICDLKYQVFISSHDVEEAKYIARKCQSSSIPVTQCHLLGPGANGVRWSVS